MRSRFFIESACRSYPQNRRQQRHHYWEEQSPGGYFGVDRTFGTASNNREGDDRELILRKRRLQRYMFWPVVHDHHRVNRPMPPKL